MSESPSICTGSSQGHVLLCTNRCASSHQSINLCAFADDTALIGLFPGGDKSAYRWDFDHQCDLVRSEQPRAKCFKDSRGGSRVLRTSSALSSNKQTKAQQKMLFLFLPVEEIQPAKDDDGALLHSQDGEPPLLPHHHLVRCSHRRW